MRAAICGVLIAGLAHGALAQQPPEAKIKLELSVEAAQLVVQTLGQIACQTVADMARCEAARETLKAIQAQAKTQGY